MARLTAVKVKSTKNPGRYGDGSGLYLVVGTDGRRAWVLRVQYDGKRRDIGLGSANDVSLAEAREKSDQLRKMIKAGKDPIAEKRAARLAERVPTFREAALLVHAENLPSWKNPKHAAQWLTTLEAHAFPHFGDTPVPDVSGPMIRDALAQIWLTIPETARRVRQRIGTVLDWAHSKGWRPTETPTRSISKGLPKQPKKDGHFAAMPWKDVPAFIAQLQRTEQAGENVRLAFEFLILTAVRSGEMRGARWDEFDLSSREWCIPAARMKAKKAHTVPLSPRAVAIMERMRELSEPGHGLVFPGSKPGRPISDMTLTMLLRRMGKGVTAHGFRSSFRDWVADATEYSEEVAEAALAHAVEDKTKAAYFRTVLLDKRRRLMIDWANFLSGPK